MNYYIADIHFGHQNVIKFDRRPFASADEMDRVIIAQWNAVVQKEDDVYILGDFCYKAKNSPLWYLKQLKGRKHLIIGNHDKHLLEDEEAVKEFASVDKMTYVKDGDKKIVLCHFPLAEWNGYWKGAWHIYGHIHNQKTGCYPYLSGECRALNAGCMINHYTPVTIEQLIENNEQFQNSRDYLCERYGEHGGDIHYTFSEYCQDGLCYHFYTEEGIRDHGHTFAEVLHAAYQYPDSFEIRKEDEHEYSKQELAFIHKFLEKYKREMVERTR